MYISKKQRQIVWEKSGGHCWYCGVELPKKGWPVDHVEAVLRDPGEMCRKPENHNIDNMVPACAPCNNFKGVFCVEDFRAELQMQAERARRYSVNFRTAERFGLVSVNDKPIVFWFEAHPNA